MKRQEVLSILQTHRQALEHLGVKSLDLFGSVARDEANAESDVDLLVEFSIDAGFFEFFRVQHYLEEILGCSVDLGTQDSLKEHLRVPVLKDAVHVF